MKVGCGKAAQVTVAFSCTASALDQPVLGSLALGAYLQPSLSSVRKCRIKLCF